MSADQKLCDVALAHGTDDFCCSFIQSQGLLYVGGIAIRPLWAKVALAFFNSRRLHLEVKGEAIEILESSDWLYAVTAVARSYRRSVVVSASSGRPRDH